MSRPDKMLIAAGLLLASVATASARNVTIDSNLNLRAGPGPTQRVVVVMPAGVTVTVGECRGEWCAVSFRGQRGYVSSALLKGGDGAYAAAPTAPPVVPQQQQQSKYDADDEVRVLNWNDRDWRDRYWKDMGSRPR